jgi:hypothetical protein
MGVCGRKREAGAVFVITHTKANPARTQMLDKKKYKAWHGKSTAKTDRCSAALIKHHVTTEKPKPIKIFFVGFTKRTALTAAGYGDRHIISVSFPW